MKRLGISMAHSAIEEKTELAKLADQAGFDAIWNSGESVPIFGAMAVNTKRALVGSGVLRAFQHDPRNLIQYAVDLQRMSGGRWLLGIGGGTPQMNRNLLGQTFEHPANRMRELVSLVRLAFKTPSSERYEFQSEYYQVRSPGVADLAPSAPIYIAGLNPTTIRLTGEIADGICGHPIASVPFIQNVVWPNLDAGLKKAGKTRADFDHATWLITSISNDRKQALRELKIECARFMATRSFRIVLDSQGLESVRLQIQEAFFKHPNSPDEWAASVPDEVASAHGLHGTPDDVRNQLKRYEDVVDIPTFYCPSLQGDTKRAAENIRSMIETFAR